MKSLLIAQVDLWGQIHLKISKEFCFSFLQSDSLQLIVF